MKHWLVPICAALFLGCATSPVRTDLAKPAVPSNVQKPTLLQNVDGSVMVVIKRDSGFTGGACAKQVYLQGEPIAKLWPGEKVTIYLQPGTYVLSAGPDGICGGKLAEVEMRLVPGDPPTYRISTGANFDEAISRTAF